MVLLRTASNSVAAFAIVAVLAAVGCGKAYQVADVEGVLMIRGAPGHNVLIQFIPDVEMGNRGPISIAETDIRGRFSLQLTEARGAMAGRGALVGWHKVVLSDLRLAASETGRGVPIRLAAKYTLPGSTPLAHEVHQGTQTIELRVP